MKKFLVSIEEVLRKEIVINAESEVEAEKMARRLYSNGEIVLGGDDFAYSDIEAVSEMLDD